MTKLCLQCSKDMAGMLMLKRRKYCSFTCKHAARKYDAARSLEVMWSRVDKNGPNGCWIYSGQVNSKGYGAFTYNGKPMVAVHRFIYQQIHGPLARSVYCLHKCDTPRCCNPEHIFLGNDADNTADKIRKGRAKLRQMAKITEAQALEIFAKKPAKPRERYTGYTKGIADQYGLSVGAVSAIWRGDSWKHVTSAATSTTANAK